MTATATGEDLTAIETGPARFKRAEAWVRRSLFLAQVETDMVSAIGRPRETSWEVLFVLVALTAMHGKGELILKAIPRIAAGLNPSQCFHLRLKKEVAYSQVESAFADLEAAVLPAIDPETGEVLKDARLTIPLEDLCNLVVRASIPGCVEEPSDQAVDSTHHETWARRRSWAKDAPDVATGSLPQEDYKLGERAASESGWPRRGHDGRHQHSADPDARDGYKSGKNLSRSEVFLGYDLHLATDVSALGSIVGSPPVIRSMHLAPAGSSKGVAGLALLDSARRVGSPLSRLLVDRGYSYLKAGTWALPVWQRKIEQVFDLHTNQRVTRPGPIPHTLWVDGDLFSDSLPKSMRRLPGYGLAMSAAEKQTLAEQYDQRQPYAYRAFGPRDSTRGTQRYRGPAVTSRLRCPNRPRSMRGNSAHSVTTSCSPEGCGCGSTLTLGPDDFITVRQREVYGTTRWRADYGRRSAVESGNAVIRTHHSLLARGSTRVFGTVKNAFLLAFIIGAANIALIASRYAVDIGASPLPPGPVSPLPRPEGRASLHSRVFKRRPRAPARAPDQTPSIPSTTWVTPSD